MGRRISALPEVKSVENVRFTFIPFQGDTAALSSIEMDSFLARAPDSVEDANVSDVRERLARGEGVLISKNFAARWKFRVGGSVRLNAPTGVLDLPVLGIVEDYRSDKGTIFIDRTLYKKYWKDDAVDFVNVNLKSGEDATKVKREIERLTAGTDHALVYTNAEFREWIGSLVDQFFLLNYMQLVVAVIVAIVGIANTLVVSVMDRRREFAIVRAIGGYRSQIRKMVLLEAVAISIVGVMVGALAAVFNIQFMSRTVSTVLAGYDVPFYFPWELVLGTFPVVVAVSLLAAWIPARHAMQMSVIEAIGYE
jgi:putative ABC transport system permease protein